MSKKAAKKKGNDDVSTTSGTIAASTGNTALTAGLAAAKDDIRVAQQMRVLEVVGAVGASAAKDKTYSPRTEAHVKQLMEVLSFCEYSRSEIAALVKRCHYDDNQIHTAVANIIEERANHASEDWGTVKTKKQSKEEKKIKDEEEKKEQERMERDMEKLRREAEKRERKEQARQAYNASHSGGPSALPPDPAILFAGAKPGEVVCTAEVGQDSEWWANGENDRWDEWETNERRNTKGNGTDWEEWSWRESRRKGDTKGRGRGGEERWQADWEEVPSSGQRGRAAKDQRQQPAKEEEKVEADPWDMPESAVLGEGARLDQWTLGDIKEAERRLESSVPGGSGMRTVEEIERDHLGGHSTGSANADPGRGKSRIEALLQDGAAAAAAGGRGKQQASSPAAPQVAESGDRQEKGRRSKGAEKGKGKDNRDKAERYEKAERDPDKSEGSKRKGGKERERAGGADGAVASGEGGEGGEATKERLERLDRSDDPRRQAVEEVGDNVVVRKHSSMGCAVVSMRDPRVREAILRQGGETIISNIRVQMKPHTDKDKKVDVPTDIFVAWGRQVEKLTPLSERDLTEHFDQKHREITEVWRADAEAERRRQQDTEKEARRRLEEEQQRQVAADQQRRLHEEQQRRQEEQRIRETQAKMMSFQYGAAAAHAGAAQTAQTSAAAAQDVAAMSVAGFQQGANAAGLHAAYPQAAAAQWNAQQWMHAMYAQQGWHPALAAQRGMQQMHGAPAGHAAATAMAQSQQAQQAAYYAAYMEQQRSQGVAATSLYQQAAAQQQAQQQQQGGYHLANPQVAFGYGAAAAAYGRSACGAERI